MKKLIQIIILLFLSFQTEGIWAQCQDIVMVDSSFEAVIEFYGYPGIPEMGKWFHDDGALSSDDAFTGNKSACSNGGGAFQFVRVDSHTTYHVSAYILNGANEEAPYPHFRINWGVHPISINVNEWTLVSTSFYSGADTIAIIGFYSLGACFDEFRVTCNPVTTTSFEEEKIEPYQLFSNISQGHYQLTSTAELAIEVWSVDGRLIEKAHTRSQLFFGSNLAKGMYVLKIRQKSSTWVERLIKW